MIFQKKKKNHKEVVEVEFKTSLYFKAHSLMYGIPLISLRFVFLHFIILLMFLLKKNLILSHKETSQLVCFLLLVYGPYLKNGHTAEKRGAGGPLLCRPELSSRQWFRNTSLSVKSLECKLILELRE